MIEDPSLIRDLILFHILMGKGLESDKIKYIAVDEDGGIMGYSSEPVALSHDWDYSRTFGGGNRPYYDVGIESLDMNTTLEGVDWKDTLIIL